MWPLCHFLAHTVLCVLQCLCFRGVRAVQQGDSNSGSLMWLQLNCVGKSVVWKAWLRAQGRDVGLSPHGSFIGLLVASVVASLSEWRTRPSHSVFSIQALKVMCCHHLCQIVYHRGQLWLSGRIIFIQGWGSLGACLGTGSTSGLL